MTYFRAGGELNCKCKTCGKEFHRPPSDIKRGNGKYCSLKCKPIWNKGKIGVMPIPWNTGSKKQKVSCICKICGKEFEEFSSGIKEGRGKHCSRKCADIGRKVWNKGFKILKDGERAKNWNSGFPKCKNCDKTLSVRKNKLGLCRQCVGTDKVYLHKLSVVHRKITGTHKKQFYSREVRNSAEFRDWRETIFKRDNYTCVLCESRGSYLHPHHIYSFSKFPKLRLDTNNGVTLCKDCHYQVHRKENSFIDNGWYINK